MNRSSISDSLLEGIFDWFSIVKTRRKIDKYRRDQLQCNQRRIRCGWGRSSSHRYRLRLEPTSDECRLLADRVEQKKCSERLHNFAKLDSLAISELRGRAVVWKFQRQTPFSQSVALSNYSFSHFTIALRDFVFIVVVVFFGLASSRSLKLMPSTDHERGRQWCDGLNSTNRFAASSLTFCHRPREASLFTSTRENWKTASERAEHNRP